MAVPVSSALAASPVVSITVSAWVWGNPPPVNFTIYYISDYEVGFTWTLPVGEVNTMIRAKYGSYPTSRTDGYLVYYGGGGSGYYTTSDTAVNLDETASLIYYRAWAEDAFGGWSVLYAEGFIEGGGMRLIALILLPLGLMIIGYAWKRQGLVFGAAGGWLLLAGYSFTTSASDWDVYYTLGWLSIGLVLVSVIEAMFVGMKPTVLPPVEKDSLDEVIEKQEAYNTKVERMEKAMGLGKSRRRGRGEDEDNTRLV